MWLLTSPYSAIRRGIVRLFAQAAEFFFGSDVFLSYSRADALDYAGELGSQLTDRKVTCYLDQWESIPGRELPLSLRLQLARSSILVLVGSPRATASEAVEMEVAAFKRMGRPIVGVNVAGALEGAHWYEHIAGAPLVPENGEALVAAAPSPSVVGRVVTVLGYRTRSRRLRTAFWATALTVAALVIVGGGALWWLQGRAAAALDEAGIARAEEKRASAAAERERKVAVSRRLAAQAAAVDERAPDLALLLGMAALNASETYEARSFLLNAVTHHPRLTGVLSIDAIDVGAMAVDPAGRVLAAAAGRRLALVDLQSHRALRCPLRIPNFHSALGDGPFPEYLLRLTFSPDGNRILGVGGFQSYIWDVATGAGVAIPGRVPAFTSPGEVLKLGGDEWDPDPRSAPPVSIWDVAHPESPRHVRDLDVEAEVTDAVVSPSGALAAFAAEAAVVLWDLSANQRLGSPMLTGATMVGGMAFSPDGSLLAAADSSGTVQIWDTATRRVWAGPLQRHGGNAPGQAVAFSRDGETLAVGSTDGWISLFARRERFEDSGHYELRLAGPQFDASWKYAERSTQGAVAFGARNDEVVSAANGVAFWQFAETNVLGRAFPHEGSTLVTAFSPTGETFATPSGGDIRLRDASSGADRAAPLPEPNEAGNVVGLTFSRDGESLIASYRNDRLGVWNLKTRTRLLVAMPSGFHLDEFAVSPHGKRAFAADNEGSGLIWDVSEPLAQPIALKFESPVTFASFGARDDELLIAQEDGSVRLWDLVEPVHPKATRRLHARKVVTAAVVREGAAIAVVYSDGLLVVDPLVPGGSAWSSQIAPSTIKSGAFDPSGSLVAVVYNEDLGRLVLWDLESNARLLDATSESDNPVFSADASRLLRSGLQVDIWDLSASTLKKAACHLVRRNFSQAERQRFALTPADASLCPSLDTEPDCPGPEEE